MYGKNVVVSGLAAVMALLLMTGCSSTYMSRPHMGFGRIEIEGGFARRDFEVLGRVEGTSKCTKILGGLVQIIDDDNLRILGISFFEDKFVDPYRGVVAAGFFRDDVYNRAYYNALAEAPDADAVICKAAESTWKGFPLIWEKRTVTYIGKAVRLKEG